MTCIHREIEALWEVMMMMQVSTRWKCLLLSVKCYSTWMHLLHVVVMMMHAARYSTAGRRLETERERRRLKNGTKDKQRDHLKGKAEKICDSCKCYDYNYMSLYLIFTIFICGHNNFTCALLCAHIFPLHFDWPFVLCHLLSTRTPGNRQNIVLRKKYSSKVAGDTERRKKASPL